MSASLRDLNPIDRNQISNLIDQVAKLQSDISTLKHQQEESDQIITALQDLNNSLRHENEILKHRAPSDDHFSGLNSISPIDFRPPKKELINKIKRLQSAKLKTWRDANNIVRGKLVYFEEEDEDYNDITITHHDQFTHKTTSIEDQNVHEASILADLLNK